MSDTPIPLVAETWSAEKYAPKDLRALMQQITGAKLTGKLKLHFNQGNVGAIEWTERKKGS